jgi:predicted transposase YbfD/YdcC
MEEKSDEITAIPKCLNVLVIKGCIVTIDAMGCRRETAGKIIDREADYILAVKGNQGSPEGNARETVRFTKAAEEWEEEDLGHGRIERRRCSVYRDLSFIEKA